MTVLCPDVVNEQRDLWRPLQKYELSYTHVRAMVEFAFSLMAKLELINTHSFNSFKLRIGECVEADFLLDRKPTDVLYEHVCPSLCV